MRKVFVSALMASLLFVGGCGLVGSIFHRNDESQEIASFLAADKQYKDDSTAYSAARAVMRAEWKAGRMKSEKWMEFRLSENAAAAATPAVAADFDEWIRTRKKPQHFEDHATALRNAQAEVVSLAKEFQ